MQLDLNRAGGLIWVAMNGKKKLKIAIFSLQASAKPFFSTVILMDPITVKVLENNPQSSGELGTLSHSNLCR